MLSLHIFTIVLNGKPFILEHLNRFKELPLDWHWHIVEGVADLVHDTSWSRATGGTVASAFHRSGLSADGTTEYLDAIARRHPERITIYRPPPDRFWEGKLEMVSAPLATIDTECILWQIDADELWTANQITSVMQMFAERPEVSAARYYCTFFVGQALVTNDINCYGNHAQYGEWLRTWRFRPGDRWLSHEPPQLCRQAQDGSWRDVASYGVFTQDETACRGAVFRHHAYCTRMQLAFKESYYGYAGAIKSWEQLQGQNLFPVRLAEYFPWVQDNTTVIPYLEADRIKTILLIRTDALGDALLSSALIPALKSRFPHARLMVVCRANLAELYETCPHLDSVIPIDHARGATDHAYRQVLVAKVQAVKPDLAIYSAWSRDPLGDELALSCGASISIAHEGDTCNILQEERNANNKRYSLLVRSKGEVRSELRRGEDLLEILGTRQSGSHPMVWTAQADEHFAESFFAESQLDTARTIALFISGTWRGKCYIHYPQALSAVLRENEFSVVAFGEVQDRGLNNDLIAKLGVPGINMAGKTSIRQAAALLKRCRMAIGIDTGLAHLACAVGIPNVIIVGGYQFCRYFPYSKLTSVACLPLECWQCNGRCRYDRAHCVFDLAPQVLEKAARETLAGKSSLPRVFIQGRTLWPKEEGMPVWRPFSALFSGNDVETFEIEA